MRIKAIYGLLLLLPLVSACQGEEVEISETPKRVITVRASLPESNDSRTHITYGNTAIDKEIFRWDEEDYISVFNLSRLSECPEGVELDAVKIDGNSAVFESVVETFHVKAGDLIFVNYWETRRQDTNDNGEIFTISIGEPKPQPIVKNPDDAYMSYMQSNLKMYDIVTAVKDDEIPDIHFRHLSAIMRVTLRNETGEDLIPKELQFEYPGTESFYNSIIYCSVDPKSSNGNGLIVYDDIYIQPYTDIVTAKINNYTGAVESAVGNPIDAGETYDLYLSCVPRIANEQTGSELIIRLEGRTSSSTGYWYEMTLDGFNKPIEAGKRYWFNLTAVVEDGERKLVFTNEWLDKHPEKKPDNGEQTTPED